MNDLARTFPQAARPQAKRAPNRPFPRLPLFAAIGLILFTIAAVIFGRVTEIGTLRVTAGYPQAIRDLRFTELANGDLMVSDGRTGETIAVSPPNTDGFVRGAVRGLTQERRTRRAALDAAYRLILWDTGRLTLSDTATGQRVPLDAFGPDNAAAFRRFFDEGSGPWQ